MCPGQLEVNCWKRRMSAGDTAGSPSVSYAALTVFTGARYRSAYSSVEVCRAVRTNGGGWASSGRRG